MNPPIPRWKYDKIQELTKQGLSTPQIATTLEISRDSVLKWRKRPYPVADRIALTPTASPPSLSDDIYAVLSKSKKKLTPEALSDHFNVGIGRVREALDQLHSAGKNLNITNGEIELQKTIQPSQPLTIDVSKFKGQKIRFGLTADNHLGSKYARMDVLNALFDIWQEEGIETVYQLGNMIDGEAPFNKFDLLVRGLEDQVNYFVEHWPQRKGMTTRFITGDDHEGWFTQREGVNVGRMIQDRADKGRKDLQFLGHMEHDVIFKAKKGESVHRMIHAGGGSAYATSYTVQKIVESYQGGEKPAALYAGHYHKAEFGYPREVLCVQAGCTEDQTPFMRKRKIQAHVGGWSISFDIDDYGVVHKFTPIWHPFFDRSFYENKQWAYRWTA